MKAEIILTIVWTSLCFCERQPRSTVLTDESKRVLEQFDFSNFDKQEALNYIDRQRYENQIRGKRSHSKFKRDRYGKKTSEEEPESQEALGEQENSEELKSENPETNTLASSQAVGEPQPNPEETVRAVRSRTRHHPKKKHRFKTVKNRENKQDKEEEEENPTRKKKRRKKKKKKRKRRYWNKWTQWSPCSVTCGRGRQIRWRKCIAKNCYSGEVEMGEKTCQLPACNLLTKLLGL